jgi:hypothetical protein
MCRKRETDCSNFLNGKRLYNLHFQKNLISFCCIVYEDFWYINALFKLMLYLFFVRCDFI